jgi:GNAT superfamily N-acetyltransferase
MRFVTARTVVATPDDLRSHRDDLCSLLRETVVDGAPLGFLNPVSDETAGRYWDGVTASLERNERIVLLALDAARVTGSVQLELASNQNARHRAKVVKLAVLPAERGRGTGRALMAAVEAEALRSGRTLLILDTREGGDAEKFYEHLGWVRSGRLPDFMRDEAGRPHAAIVFHKNLGA